MLRVFHSNRYELLVDELGRLLRQHSNSPLQRQTIVIPETGIARWTWMSLANNHGISANLEFVLPGSFVWRLFHLLLPDVNDTSPYDIRIMTLRLFELLEEVLQEPGNDALGPWRDSDELRRFQLAQKLAIQFDQYIVYRPRWIARASAGKETDWQARLWQRLAQHTGEPDWMALRARLETLSSESVQAVLTRPVYLLGIPLLSPGYFEVLEWLAQHVDVHLLIPNPSRAYWGDIVAPQDAPRIAGVGDQQALYLEQGNRLLASWGRQARDLIDMIDASAAVNDDNFVDPADDSLLHHLHGQILDLEEPATPIGLHAGDRSLQVHACHTPMREVEVLYDQLLALFDADATLEPSAVMVMTPDIQTYAPCIDAVFGSRERIAYRICGSDDVQGQPLVASFLAIARLQQSRFDANEVLALLDNPAVRRRFGLQPDDIASLRSWIHKTGIRWGLDENNRPGLEGDAARLHTWEYGLSSMLLGWMLPDDKQGIHKSTLLFSEIEGSDALVAAALAEFVERLAVFHRDSQRPRTIQQWAGWLQRQLDLFFQPDQAEEVQAQLLRDALAKLHEYAAAANNESTFSLATVLHW
ncbi:MAG: exodeoxyribonuclease V subunit gamma, partial [Gammaproteobacteria bacterium]|nr:exodeoxyribonuclease V subunit gamma [Gammaproteobacteria bacterium]